MDTFSIAGPPTTGSRASPQRELGLFHLGPILDHGVQLNFDCWHHYLDTGDLEAVREPFPRLLRFANYLHELLGADGLLPVENLGIPCVWMDYQAYQQSGQMPHLTQRRKQCAFNLYTAAMLQHALAPLCRAFGDAPSAKAVERLRTRSAGRGGEKILESASAAFSSTTFPGSPKTGRSTSATARWPRRSCSINARTTIRSAAVQALAECPREMGLSYPANAGWRLRALAKAGRADVDRQGSPRALGHDGLRRG